MDGLIQDTQSDSIMIQNLKVKRMHYHTFPDQSMIVKIFEEIKIYINEKYDLRKGLIKKNL